MRMKPGLLVLAMVLSAGSSTTAVAQRRPLTPATSLPDGKPFKDWDALAQVLSSWHGKVLLATVAEPKRFMRCQVKDLTATAVICKRRLGKPVVYGREQIAGLAAERGGNFEWGEVLGMGLVGAIGASAGYGTAVLIGVGGAALFAAAPLALVAVSVGLAISVYSGLLIADSSHARPGTVLYQRPEAAAEAALGELFPEAL